MIITKKEFETITDKAIEKTFKEAQEKQKQLNVDMTAETGKQLKKDVYKVLQLLYKGISLDIFEDKEFAKAHGVRYTTLDELLEKSDIISLHCPLTPETRYLINENSIRKMKEGVLLINTGRGQLVDTAALIEGLKEQRIAGAALDVYEREGEYFYRDCSNHVLQDDLLARLLSFNNVIVSSHQAFFTREALTNIATSTLESVQAFLANKPLLNEVK